MKKMYYLVGCLLFFTIVQAQNATRLLVNGYEPKQTISRHIYGHFSEHLGRCIYDGFWVKDTMNVPKKDRIRLDIVEALKKINIPNLRWPGGCFADEYHWRDGIGPRNLRPSMNNTNWGNVVEDNSFGTHEFLDLCSLLHCEPYITGNVGSGTVEEMSKWIEYLNYDGQSPLTNLRKENGRSTPWNVSFWGVGNESWGCGGSMTPEFYSDQFKRYGTFARNYPNAKLKKIATGPNSEDYNWTDVLMKNVGNRMWGITLHYYTIPSGSWSNKGSATQFDEKEYFGTMCNCLRMETMVAKHATIMDKYDPEKKVSLVVDEWGIWTNAEPNTNPSFLYQQNSLRDALIAATTLNIFNNHSDRVRMANLAQTVNVLQALILTKGRQILLTPTYYVFDLYKVHQDAKYLPIQINSPDYVIDGQKIPAVNVSASRDSLGVVHISLVNLDATKTITIKTTLAGVEWEQASARVLTSAAFTDVNTFDKPNNVKPVPYKKWQKEVNDLSIELPPLSVVAVELK